METPTHRVVRGAPYFLVRDVGRALREYEDVFGFHREYVGGAPPEFAIVSRDGLPIMLRLGQAGAIVPNEAQGGTWDVFFWVHDLGGLVAELSAAGAAIVYGPVDRPEYRMREFAVRDGDGHVLGFGEELQDAPVTGTPRADHTGA